MVYYFLFLTSKTIFKPFVWILKALKVILQHFKFVNWWFRFFDVSNRLFIRFFLNRVICKIPTEEVKKTTLCFKIFKQQRKNSSRILQGFQKQTTSANSSKTFFNHQMKKTFVNQKLNLKITYIMYQFIQYSKLIKVQILVSKPTVNKRMVKKP